MSSLPRRALLQDPAAAARPLGPPAPVRALVRPQTDLQRSLVISLDDRHTTHDDGAVEVLLWEGDLERLQSAGMPAAVRVVQV